MTAEELQAACEGKGLIMLYQLLQRVRDTETIPSNWEKTNIIPIHKKDKMICDNYRGTSRLCHASKIFTSVLLQRLRKSTDENLAEKQAGIRTRTGTREQIFILRKLSEKYIEFNKNLYVRYVKISGKHSIGYGYKKSKVKVHS